MYPFWSIGHFLDLQYSDANHDFKSRLFEDLVEEGFYISKYTHTSYPEIEKITPLKRKILIKLISEDIESRNKAYEEARKAIKEI